MNMFIAKVVVVLRWHIFLFFCMQETEDAEDTAAQVWGAVLGSVLVG